MGNNKKQPQRKLHTDENSFESLQNKCSQLEHQIEELTVKVKWYEEQFRLSQIKKFGSSSEKTEADQLDFFNEAEKNERPQKEEPELEEIIYKRKKTKGLNKSSMANLPVEVIEYEIPEDERNCPVCEEPLHKMTTEIRRELKVIPAEVKIVKHVRNVYACRNCEKENIETPIITAPMPKPVLPGSFVSPSLMAFIMHRKYSEAIPLYRQEQQFVNFGIEISRQNMANWVMHGANKWLKVLYDRVHEHLVKETYLHADETTLQVLDEKNKSAKSKSYMWLYASATHSRPMFLYDYQPSRSHKHPQNFLKDFKGFLQTDGYPAYEKVEDVTLVGCFAHARRYFVDVIKAAPKDSDFSSSIALEGKKFCDDLFAIERKYKDLSLEDRHEKRLEESKPLLEAFLSWLKEKKQKVLPKSGLGKAITYSLKQWDKLSAFIKDPQSEISNNRAERAIKPFVIGRKNFLFSKCPKGATASAITYSIIETAKANRLSPFHYLTYLFEKLPNVNINDSEELDLLLPWSESIPDHCKIQSFTE